MNFYCENPGPLSTDPANPVANISSEAPDFDVFIGRNYGRPTPPYLGPWVANGCLGQCESSISQEDADLCAARQSDECIFDTNDPLWPVWNPNNNPSPPPGPNGPPPTQPPYLPVPRTVYVNTAQSCDFTCADGSTFTYTVAAGLFTGVNQVEADNRAQSYACLRVAESHVCIGSLAADDCCFGSDFNQTVAFNIHFTPAVVFIVNGGLPTGMSLTYDDDSFTISGTAAGVGTYSFTIQVEDADGNFMQKAFSISVATIANTTLADGDLNVAYSQTLMTSGPIFGLPHWTVVGGALPTGLTLNLNTGAISGTPTVAGDYTFTVQMEDGF